MQPRDVRHWLWDVRLSCDLILEGTRGLTLAQLVQDRLRRSAVEREFEIIGEAMKRVLAAEPGLSLRFPEARDIIAFRNHLAHGYHVVDYDEVWDSIVHGVPRLRAEAMILNERPPLNP